MPIGPTVGRGPSKIMYESVQADNPIGPSKIKIFQIIYRYESYKAEVPIGPFSHITAHNLITALNPDFGPLRFVLSYTVYI